MNTLFALLLLMGVVCMVTCGSSSESESGSHESCGDSSEEHCHASKKCCDTRPWLPKPKVLCKAGDIDCVRDKMSELACCKRVDGQPSEIHDATNLYLSVPSAHMVGYSHEIQFTNIEHTVYGLEIDETGSYKLHHGVIFDCHAPSMVFACFDRTCATPKVFATDVNARYITNLTMTWSAADGCQTSANTNVFASVSEHSEIRMGDEFMNDPKLEPCRSALIANIKSVFKEVFETKGFYVNSLINKNMICDNGEPPQKHYDSTVLDSLVSDSKDDTVQPCQGSGDLTACFADAMVKHGSCSPVRHPRGRSVCKKGVVANVPLVDIKIERKESCFTVLNSDVTKFSWNKHAGVATVVLQTCLDHFTPTAYGYYYSDGKAPWVEEDFTEAHYCFSLSASFPYGGNKQVSALTLKKGVYMAQSTEESWYDLGRRMKESKNEGFRIAVKVAMEHMTQTSTEVLNTDPLALFQLSMESIGVLFPPSH